ncbi:MAG TPA: DUF3617 domain-containing protein [Allosphingosinicella sp.]|nr:DUF3617 domain-containing protein [Allosphingosinicella sp.]
MVARRERRNGAGRGGSPIRASLQARSGDAQNGGMSDAFRQGISRRRNQGKDKTMRMLSIAIPCAVLLSGYASLATQGSSEVAPSGIEPGQWELVTEMTSVEVAGAPEEILQQMRASMAEQRQTESQCITPEQARNPSANMMGSGNPAGCEFSDTIWAGGTIRLRATCRPPGSPPVQISVEGTYTARQINNRIHVAMDMPDPNGAETPMHLKLGGRMTGRRTGDCTSPQVVPGPEGNSAAPVN